VKFSDFRPGDHVVWSVSNGKPRHEVFIVSVDHERRTWTHITLVDEHRPDNVGQLFNSPISDAMNNLWDCEGDGEIVSRLT
jgi:hypothetical protein